MSDEKKTEKTGGLVPERVPAPPMVAARGASAGEPARQSGIDQVREILFGATYRDLDLRLARADAHVAARINDLEQEARKRSEVIEAHHKKEAETLAARFDR